jgi:predicted aspartyl protease
MGDIMVQDTPHGALARRHFIAGAASLAGLAPLPALSQTVITPNTDVLPGAVPNDESARVVAGRNASQHLTIQVNINGRGPFNFIVDTGAELSVLADDVAAQLNLPEGAPITVEGVTGRIKTRLVPVDQLSVGPLAHNNLKLPILPRAFLRADGFLGLDVINGSRVTFDFLGKSLKIERSRRRFDADDKMATRVRTSGRDGRLKATNARVDNVQTTAFIDTGAEISVGNPALEAALRRRRKGVHVYGPAILTDITGTQISGDVIAIKGITLQNLHFTSGALVVADVPSFDTFHLNEEPAILIGMDYLRQFASVSIDYRLKEIRFELAEMTPPAPIRIERA